MNTISIPKISRIILLGVLVLSTACSPLIVNEQPTNIAPLPTQDINAIYTSAVQTFQAQTPTRTATPTTGTSMPPTAMRTEAAQPVTTPELVVVGCQDAAQYISDDGLDGTTYAPNTAFTKTWTVKNTGTCAWDDRYLVSYISGTTMTQQPGYFIVQKGQTVAPGQTVNISVGMTSPVENGNYRSYWGLEDGNGQLMPIQGGTNGNSFYAKIKVYNGAAAGKVTAAYIDIKPEQGSGQVCAPNSTYFVHASITADGPATASYEISSSAGQIAAGNFEDLNNNSLTPTVDGNVVFDQAGTKSIDLRFVGPYPYPDNITVVLRVNGGEFYNSKLSC